jgi:hemolysin activation/secretion protein
MWCRRRRGEAGPGVARGLCAIGAAGLLWGPGADALAGAAELRTAQAAPKPPAAAPAASPRFDVLEFEVRGNTVLPVVAIERAVYPFLGERRTIDDVEQARAALEEAYRRAGFPTVIVNVPEQRVEGGVVVLDVTEAKLARVRVVGARYYSQGRILERLPALAEGEVPDLAAAQEQLADVNRSPNLRVTPVIRPGRVPGTSELDLQVEDSLPLRAGIELSNNYTPNTEPLRLTLSASYDNLFQRDHRIGAVFQVSPQDTSQVKVGSLSYFVPGPKSAWYWSLYGLVSRSAVGATAGGTNVLGDGTVIGTRFTVPLRSTENLSDALSFGVDYKNFKQLLVLPGLPGLPTPINYWPWYAGYTARLADKSGVTELGASVGFTLRDIGTDSLEFENARFKAQSNYILLRYSLARTQELPASLSLHARVDGQLASGPLVSYEQYAAGGIDNVRGYLAASALGDDAVHLTAELRSPSFADGVSPLLSDLRFLVFAEGARLRVIDPLPQQVDRYTLASVGVGLRVRVRREFSMQLDYGYALRDAPFTESGRGRVQFIAAGSF